MRAWSSRALVNDIANANLSQKDVAKYWIFGSIFYWLLFGWGVPSGDIALFPYYLKIGFSVISLLVAVIGFAACYRSNGGVSGERLLDKFTALFFVASIRGLVFVLIPSIFAFAVIFVAIYYPGELGVFPKYLGGYLSFLFYKFFVYFSVARNLELINIRSAV